MQRSEAVGLSEILTTAGAGFEVLGLGFTGFALWDRGQRHDAPPGRARRAYRWIDDRIRVRLGRPRTHFVHAGSAGAIATAGQVRVRTRPGDVAHDASVDDKVAWLMRYVEHLDRDIQARIEEHDTLATELRSEHEAATETIEDRLARQGETFNEEMIADLGSAWFGLALAIVGVCLGLAGYWLS